MSTKLFLYKFIENRNQQLEAKRFVTKKKPEIFLDLFPNHCPKHRLTIVENDEYSAKFMKDSTDCVEIYHFMKMQSKTNLKIIVM